MSGFTPENELESTLVAAASDPARIPAFYRALVSSQLLVIDERAGVELGLAEVRRLALAAGGPLPARVNMLASTWTRWSGAGRGLRAVGSAARWIPTSCDRSSCSCSAC
jgi:hypothetical protein